MSHYTVGIVIDKSCGIEELDYYVGSLLGPFDENIEVDQYIDEYRFNYIMTVYKRKEQNREILNEMINDPETFCKQRHMSIEQLEDNKKRLIDRINKTIMVEVNENLEHEDLDMDGNILSTYNPDSKWDWYIIGGRWAGSLVLKTGENVDFARFKDIDYDATYYNENYGFSSEKELVEQYHKDPGFKEYIDSNYINLESFISLDVEKKPFSYAMLIDEKWIEPGRMGMFGISNSGDDDRDRYDKEIVEYLENKKESEDWLVIVDCHI